MTQSSPTARRVLLTGAKADHAGRFGVAPGNLGRERADQGGHNAACCIGCKHGRVVALCACRLRDLVGGKSRNHADRGLRACQRNREIEQPLNPGARGDKCAHARGRGQ